MEKLNIYNVGMFYNCKKKKGIFKRKIIDYKSEEAFVRRYFIAESFDKACEKFKRAYDIDNYKDYIRKTKRGYDFTFHLSSCNTEYIRINELIDDVPLSDFMAYMRQELNKEELEVK